MREKEEEKIAFEITDTVREGKVDIFLNSEKGLEDLLLKLYLEVESKVEEKEIAVFNSVVSNFIACDTYLAGRQEWELF